MANRKKKKSSEGICRIVTNNGSWELPGGNSIFTFELSSGRVLLVQLSKEIRSAKLCKGEKNG